MRKTLGIIIIVVFIMNKQLFCWDFTLWLRQKGKQIWEKCDAMKLLKQLKEICKAGNFQLEEGQECGRLHFQGRVSTKKRYRKTEIIKLATDSFLRGIRWSPTSDACKGNFDYVTKDFTRIEGPWDVKQEIVYIPRQIREIEELRPFQKQIIHDAEIWDTRHINVVYNPEGCVGKSILKGYLRAHGIGRPLPPVNDYKDMMRMVCDMPTARLYIIDMPKAMKKDKLGGLYSAIETIKDGYAWDDRYKFCEKIFDCPNIWVFTNTLPDFELLSSDRWFIWDINMKTYKLKRRYRVCDYNKCENTKVKGYFGATL